MFMIPDLGTVTLKVPELLKTGPSMPRLAPVARTKELQQRLEKLGGPVFLTP